MNDNLHPRGAGGQRAWLTLQALDQHAAMRCTVLLAALAAFSSAAHAQYEVRVDSDTQVLSLSLELPTGSGVPTKLVLRGEAWGLKPQVENVRCASGPLARDADGSWSAPPDCRKVLWTVVPDRLSGEGADASEQRSLADARGSWVLLAEPTGLLRRQGDTSAATLRAAPRSVPLVGATPEGAGGFRVPSANGAPEFYVLGAAPTSRRSVGALRMTYVADEPERVRSLGLERLHAAALGYLSSVFARGARLDATRRNLLVMWLGVAASKGRVGGAAGEASFVANYVVGPRSSEGVNTAMATAVIAHEQFHQLTGAVRQGATLPVWLGESLAQYYGLKALRSADHSDSASAVQARFIDPSRNVESGLLELHRRFASGDQAVYGLFYSQGATFWQAIDAAIADATSGGKSLDDYVTELIRAEFPDDGGLPAAFIARLRDVAGSSVDPIIAKYLGR